MSWLQSKKSSFGSVVFSCCMPKQQTISQLDVMWDQMDCIQQPAMTSSGAGPRRSSKALPKAKLAPKIVMVTVCWSAAGLIHHSLLNPSETITSEKYVQQINGMHSKLKHLQPALVNRKKPILLLNNTQLHVAQPMFQKLKKLGCKVLPYSPDLSPTNYHFFKHLNIFLQGKCFHNQWDAENAFQKTAELWNMDFYATGINQHFSLAKMCWL